MKLEIKKIGNSDGVILPRELMQRLDLKRGQQLYVVELAGGGSTPRRTTPTSKR